MTVIWTIVDNLPLAIGILCAAAAVVWLEALNDMAKHKKDPPPLDWKLVTWWDLKETPERIADLLAQLEENESFLARLQNCNTEADLKKLVTVQWTGMSRAEQSELSWLMDGIRDREDWIERTIQHQCGLLSSLLDETEKVCLWHRQNTTKRTEERRGRGADRERENL